MIPNYILFLDFLSVCIENAIINLWLDDGEISFKDNFALTTNKLSTRQLYSVKYCKLYINRTFIIYPIFDPKKKKNFNFYTKYLTHN